MSNISKHNDIRVFVLDKLKRPLMPCHPARARKLLRDNKAAVYRRYPFTIILKDRLLEDSVLQPIELRVDPGSKTTGLSLVSLFNNVNFILIWAAHLQHRTDISDRLTSRRMYRRNRRNRKTRYRRPKFRKLRSKKDTSGKASSNKLGWLPPSLRSRIDNVYNWTIKLLQFVPFDYIAIESVNFDTHRISSGRNLYGAEYSHGTLHGYTIKQYLLELYQYSCAYCGAKNTPLEIEHMIPKSRGGTNNIDNLTIACTKCNQKKGNKTPKEFGNYPKLVSKDHFKDMAVVNSTKNELVKQLQSIGLETNKYDAVLTKYNRKKLGYIKDHYIDACCVGPNPAQIKSRKQNIYLIIAKGRGHRNIQLNDKYGFKRRKKNGEYYKINRTKRIKNFSTGDIVIADIPKSSKFVGLYESRIHSIRTNEQFTINDDQGDKFDTSYRNCRLIHRNDGYQHIIL